MKNKIIDLLAKFSGAAKLWEVLDGKKTYLAASASILSGVAGLILQLVAVEQTHSVAALLDFIKGLPMDQSWLMVVGGLGVLGLGHKQDKAADTKEPEAPK